MHIHAEANTLLGLTPWSGDQLIICPFDCKDSCNESEAPNIIAEGLNFVESETTVGALE